MEFSSENISLINLMIEQKVANLVKFESTRLSQSLQGSFQAKFT